MLELKHLTKKFGDNLVLNDISGSIMQGDKVVIIGPSGSGKSTFLRSLNLLERPTSGTITFEGVDITSLLKGLGGRENILSADNCATRLRMELKDAGLMNEQLLKRAGAKGVIKLGKNSVQVIIGLKVQAVADAVRNRLK